MNNLDRAVNNELLIVSKSLLPYLNLDKQRTAAIFIKVIELVYTMSLFSDETTVRSMSRSQETGWEKDFLNDVKGNLSNDKAYFIDVILKLTEAKDLLTRSPDGPSHSASNEPEYHLHAGDSGFLNDMPFPQDEAASPTPAPSSSSEKTAKSSSNGPSPEQLISGLSSLLDPNQTQLLKMLSSLFKPNS